MQIQKYIHADNKKVDFFGEHYVESRYDFDWYIGIDKMGVIGHGSSEAEAFIEGILVTNNALVLVPSLEHPKIYREGISLAKMRGHDSGIPEIKELIKLIQAHEQIHMYISSEEQDEIGRVLTFSPQAPSHIYSKGEIMPVKIDQKALNDEKDLERTIKETNITIDRVMTRLGLRR